MRPAHLTRLFLYWEIQNMTVRVIFSWELWGPRYTLEKVGGSGPWGLGPAARTLHHTPNSPKQIPREDLSGHHCLHLLLFSLELLTSFSTHHKGKGLCRMIEWQNLVAYSLYLQSIWAAWTWAKETPLAEYESFIEHNRNMLIQDYPILQWLPGLCTNWFPTHLPALVPYHCLSVALVPATLASLFYSKTDTLCLGDFAFVGPLPRTLSSVSAQLASLPPLCLGPNVTFGKSYPC